jgi:hypothetical protein
MALFWRDKDEPDSTSTPIDTASVASSAGDDVVASGTGSAAATVPDLDAQPAVVTPEVATGWPSNQPIVVGNPGPSFEPKGTDEEYRVIPCRPDTVIDGWSTGPFTVRAATVRGYFHRYVGSPRQDDFAIVLKAPDGPLIVAVADGVSAALHSHLGSTTAVRYASQWLLQELPDDIDQTDWRRLLESAAWALVEQARVVLSLEQVDAELAEQAMATTLVCAVCQPVSDSQMAVWLVGVGDSGAWVLDGDRFTPVLGGKAASESGISSSAVVGLPRVPNDVQAAKVTVDSGQVLLLGSDGFGDPLGGGTGDVGRLFSNVLGGDLPPPLLEFAHALDFSRETFDDDRTLVAVWPFHPSRPRVSDDAASATAAQPGETSGVPSELPDGVTLAPEDQEQPDGGSVADQAASSPLSQPQDQPGL